jgi:hypothetical protein
MARTFRVLREELPLVAVDCINAFLARPFRREGKCRHGGYISMAVNSAVLTRMLWAALRLFPVPHLPVSAKAGQRNTFWKLVLRCICSES